MQISMQTVIYGFQSIWITTSYYSACRSDILNTPERKEVNEEEEEKEENEEEERAETKEKEKL